MVQKQSKDWHIMEFFVPIVESKNIGDDFLIRGIAINETTTRNGISYIASELEKAAPSFRSKPILLDHENSVKNIVGRTTENVNFNSMKKGIEFEAKIMDKEIQEMINDGRITDVSIGAKVEDLQHDKKENTITAIGMEGLEISLVAVPGDPGANLANAMDDSFMIKEMMMNNKEVDIELNTQGGDKMAEEGETQEQPEEEEKTKVEDEAVENSETEEKLKKVEAELAKYKKAEETAKLKEVLKKEIMAELKEQKETTPPVEADADAGKEKSEPEDETKGVVGEPKEEEESATESLVIEKADTGKGFAMYRDYTKEANRFKRLVRE